jgi:glycosidase
MIRRTTALVALSLALAATATAAGCGNDNATNPDYGSLPEAGGFNPGSNGSGSGYGSGANNGTSSGSTGPFDAGPPQCPDSLKVCPEPFTFPYNGETSVEIRGSWAAGAWASGIAMQHVGASWTASVDAPWAQAVEYKFWVNGSTWQLDPGAPTITDTNGTVNNVKTATTCPNDYLCTQPGALPAGEFDWRDAVIYFVFVDRFLDGNSANNCSVSGASTAQYTSANYLGGDWAGVTQKINAGYFNTLGVNTLWITVPVENADNVLGAGVSCNNGSCSANSDEFTAYHGYWPSDPTKTEACFGSSQDLQTLVQSAHAKGLKVLFDYAMVDIHTSSAVYTAHVNDSPSWFTPFCQCGDTNNGCGNYNDYKCWFAPYLAHFDFTNSSAARTYSVGAALQLVQTYGNDAYRLDAIKQVDPSWLAALRPQVNSYETQIADGGVAQHFYMVGETYDFDDMAYIRSFIDPGTKLDGQFDFPLRYRLVQAVLLRDSSNMLDPAIPGGSPWTFNQPGGMKGLAAFMDYNDAFYAPGTVMSTFIGNHDLPRSIHYAEQTIPSWLGGNAGAALTTNGQGNAWSGEPVTETDSKVYERLANAFAILLTNRGAPLIYYGDEIGLPGAGDPDNRRLMDWSVTGGPQQTLHDRVAALGTIRAGHPAMRRGSRSTLYADADLWVYELTSAADGDTVYVGVNRSDGDLTTTTVPPGLPELLAGGTSSATTTIPARQTRIFTNSASAIADGGADAH